MPSQKPPNTRHASYRHGMRRTLIYSRWIQMVRRCHDPLNDSYYLYGALGVTVCDRWRDFVNFYADMGDIPPGKTLDRIDTKKGYSPENCRWATPREQVNNRRNTVFVECDGIRKPVSEWAEIVGIGSTTIVSRIRRGWSATDALYKPVKKLSPRRIAAEGRKP